MLPLFLAPNLVFIPWVTVFSWLADIWKWVDTTPWSLTFTILETTALTQSEEPTFLVKKTHQVRFSPRT